MAELIRGNLPEGFDARAYLALNPDVAASGADPVEHFLAFGINERRPYSQYAASQVDMLDLDRGAPVELDCRFYRELYPDLRDMSDAALMRHYDEHGRSEGRVGTPAATRGGFTRLISGFTPALEIGPFNKPVLKGEGVAYFDVVDREALVRRAGDIGESGENVPHIDFVSGEGDLRIIDRKFKLIFSSHSIEHQTDLVSHLEIIKDMLSEGGIYALIVPDCRYCFDHFLRPSTIADALQANVEKRKLHPLKSVIEHHALTTHNNSQRHWQGDHGTSEVSAERVGSAIAEWEARPDQYIDVHSWQFTPQTFRVLIEQLRVVGKIGLQPYRVYDTPYGSNEFCALLRA